MAFPSTLSSFNRPSASDKLNSPSHSALHNTVSSAVGQLEAVIGLEGDSSVAGTLVYDIRSPASDGGGHVQAVNKGGTGQTSYTKGDILVAQSSSVLSKLAVGATDGLVLTVNSAESTGLKWGVGTSPTVRVYAGSITGLGGVSVLGNWTKPSNLSYAIIEVVGAGGGGGGTTTATTGTAGGGGGGYARKVVLAANLPVAASILVGMGGPGGSVAGATGGTGGTTRFASVVAASGGVGGTENGDGGLGGLGESGDFNIRGSSGGGGQAGANIPGGDGGNSFYGGGAGGQGTSAEGDGANGGLYGGGGGGAFSTGSDRPGGHGADGIVIITEY